MPFCKRVEGGDARGCPGPLGGGLSPSSPAGFERKNLGTKHSSAGRGRRRGPGLRTGEGQGGQGRREQGLRSQPAGDGRSHLPPQPPSLAKDEQSAGHVGVTSSPALSLSLPATPWVTTTLSGSLEWSLPPSAWCALLRDLFPAQAGPGRAPRGWHRPRPPVSGKRRVGSESSWPCGPEPPGNRWSRSRSSWTRLPAGPGTIIKSRVSIEELYCREGL